MQPLGNPAPAGEHECDVVVVGGGPGGSATAAMLAKHGHHVILIEKERYPRDKTCGDGLTPRAVVALQQLGLYEEAAGEVDGFAIQKGLRIYGGDMVWNLPWPETDRFPSYSLTSRREILDYRLAEYAQECGATIWSETKVTEPVFGADPGHCTGVMFQSPNGAGQVRANYVVAADGGSSRIAVKLGLPRDQARPMGTAVRAYYKSPRASMQYMESHLEMRAGDELLPGYGWIFPLDHGLVNVGWGLISTSPQYQKVNYRQLLDAWVNNMPESWEISTETQVGRAKSSPLPMAHNRHPHLYRGVLLVGDAGGMVSPFNGEGISYALEAGYMAAEAIDSALANGSHRALEAYPAAVRAAWGGYFRLGIYFLEAMGNKDVMRLCTQHGLPRRYVLEFVNRTMAQLINEPRPHNITDVVIGGLSRLVRAA
ncbi:geranylgeranyl reductase family protein [Stomatohabitans albus]|uniref:NAD(P)/FAD-dependent oxidoreductase n=1 Tax=Stomatohabitans albus TaxID=3110766 RepID=UPI00300C595D